MIDIQKSLNNQSIYEMVRIEFPGRYETNNPTEPQIRKYKRYGRQWFKDDKCLYAYEDNITPIIMNFKPSTPK